MAPLTSTSTLFILASLSLHLSVHATLFGWKGPPCGEKCKGLFNRQCKQFFCPTNTECKQEGACKDPPGIVRCVKTTKAICMKPDGEMVDDPHMRGFDGTTFGFHGVDDRHYVLFGRKGGDLIVGKMISTSKVNPVGVPVTFFGEIGASVGASNDKVRLSFEVMKGHDLSEETFSVRVNDNLVSSDHIGDGYEVTVDPLRKGVRIETADASYRVTAIKAGTEAHHFNLKIFLNRQATATDAYLGVLGATLNRKTGRDVSEEFGKTLRLLDLEHHLRAMYEVQSMFPEHLNNAERASDAVRYDGSPSVAVHGEQLVAESLEKLD